MPELPDVEIFKRYLDSTALHKRIAGVTVRNQRILRGLSPPRLARALRGRQFQSSRRHGKLLFIQLGSEAGWLVFHFGMTGFLKYFKEAKEEPPHTRLRVDFANGAHLAFDCQRLFGKVMLTDNVESFIESSHVGPDALGLDWRQFRDRLAGTNRSIKSVLMDQSKIAGIGNVYSDENPLSVPDSPSGENERVEREGVEEALPGHTEGAASRHRRSCRATPAAAILATSISEEQ